MPLFRRPLPRRAFWAAALGALYGVLILPDPASLLGLNLLGVAWMMLAIGLLFLVPLAYHVYTLWGVVWIVWRVVSFFQNPAPPWVPVVDLALPAASLALLMSSGYLDEARSRPEPAPE